MTGSAVKKRKTGAALVECANCRVRNRLIEWDETRKTWVCPSCEISIWEQRQLDEAAE